MRNTFKRTELLSNLIFTGFAHSELLLELITPFSTGLCILRIDILKLI